MTFMSRVAIPALALTLASFCVAAQAEEIAGITEVGAPGISFTTKELMTLQRQADLLTAGMVKPPRNKPRLVPNLPKQAGDSTAPAAAAMTEALRLPALNAQTLSTSFTAVTFADTNAFPPDSMGTVGPTQFIVAVNGLLRSFDKTTGVADGVLNIQPDTFFASVMTPPIATTITSDPRIRYDRLTGRWFIEIIDAPAADVPNRSLLAVSDAVSAGIITASTVWTFYYVSATAGEFADYCTMGIDANAAYIGCNMFSAVWPYNFVNTDGYVVRKSSVLSGGPISVTRFPNLLILPTYAGPYTPQGVDNYDPLATVGYFVGTDGATFGTLMIRRISNPASASPTISGNISLGFLEGVPATNYPFLVPHLGNTGGNNGRLDALDDRLFAAHLRNGRLWTAHNIAVDTNGAATSTTTVGRNGVRWYELTNLTTTPVVWQTGTIFDNNATLASARWYWIPTVMVSGQGHAAVGFSSAGANFHANASFTGRLVSDSVGAMPGPLTNITNSSAAYNPPGDPGGATGRRWGDFSYTSLDPIDDMTMWTIQEYTDSTNFYGVRAAKLAAPPPATPSDASPPSVAAGLASVSVTITGTQISGSGFYDPGANLAPPALPFNHIAASLSGVTVNSVTYVNPTTVTLDLSTVGAAAGGRTVTITNPDGQAMTGGVILTITSTAGTNHFSVTAPASVTAGVAFNITVTALDASNAVDTAYAGTVHFSSADALAVLPANGTLTNGVGIFSATLKSAGTQAISAADVVSGAINGTTSPITVVPAAATNFLVLAPVSAAPNIAFNVSVTALDTFGNIASGYAGTAHFTSTDAAAVLPTDATLTNGVGSFPTKLNTTGNQTVTATDTVMSSITGTTGTIAVADGGPVLLGVVMRKTHGTAGTFDLPLSLVVPPAINHNPVTESRSGPNHTVVFTFDRPLLTFGFSPDAISEGTAGLSGIGISGNDVILNYSGVPNVQYVTFRLTSATATAAAGGATGGPYEARVGFLFGDANQSRQVTVADVGIVNAALLQAVTSANFLLDVNVDGKLTVADKGLANSVLLQKLPAP